VRAKGEVETIAAKAMKLADMIVPRDCDLTVIVTEKMERGVYASATTCPTDDEAAMCMLDVIEGMRKSGRLKSR